MTQPDPRRRLPRTDAVLADPRLGDELRRLGRDAVKRVITAVLDEARGGRLALNGEDGVERVVSEVSSRLPTCATTLRPVLNATWVVLHTNLGRAPLSDAAVSAVDTARGYVDIEYDLEGGQRAKRGRGALAAMRRAVPDAGDALVVNNGAAALLLATTALAGSGEVVVSRGEMVEIGDGFRLPELIAATGTRLREVGTTNRTVLDDYAAALGPQTGCVLKVHPSNFRIDGFTGAVPVTALTGLGVPVVADLGSGLLGHDPLLPDEPDVTSALRAGADVVTCSGDKLLGGPQAGLIFGTVPLIARLRRHPLARALRIDKLTAAALEATLDGPPTPVAQYLHGSPDAVRRRVDALTAAINTAGPAGVRAETVPSDGVVGGGGAPGLRLPGWAVALPADFAPRLRRGTPPVVGRVEAGRCLLDPRCVPDADDPLIVQAVLAAAGS
jgi:L-seryl-tRNA(Ser) seleniumtransferase